MECYWKDLGDLHGPDRYLAPRIGWVHVTQAGIDRATGLGGNILLALGHAPAAPRGSLPGQQRQVDEWSIVGMTPVADDHVRV